MRESNIVNILRQILGRWLSILLISLAVALAAGIFGMVRYSPSYQTQTLIAVYGRNSTSGVYTAQQTSDVFAEILSSNLLPKKVAEDMGLAALPGRLSCSNVPNTNLITITATASTPRDAMVTIRGLLEHHQVVTDKLLANSILQVLEPPQVPTAPIAQFEELKVLVVAFCFAVALQCAVLFAVFYFRDDIKNESEIAEKLDTKLFATVYHENMKQGKGIFSRNREEAGKGILITNPVTGFGYIETMHKMAARLGHQIKEHGFRTLLVTSVNENDGKTTVAANLALALARTGKRVLLLDLDLRKPAMFKMFRLGYGTEHPQVGDVLVGSAFPEAAIRLSEEGGVYIIAGQRSYRNADRMLDSVPALLSALREKFDLVIIDTPPLSVAADTEEIIRSAEAALLVIRQNGAIAKDINDAVDVFRANECRLLGCVFNNVHVGLFDGTLLGARDDHYRYRYGYYRRYSHYDHYDHYAGRNDVRENHEVK